MSRSRKNNPNRIKQDAYQTPVWCVDKILSEIDFSKVKTFLEPCKGDGNIYNRIPTHVKKYYCEIKEGFDYLDDRSLKNKVLNINNFDLIITNPPYSLAQEFLDKSLKQAKTVVYLLRLNFLESQKRAQWWQGKEPTHIFVLSKRPSFTGKGTDAAGYGWMCWNKGQHIKRKPGIYVI